MSWLDGETCSFCEQDMEYAGGVMVQGADGTASICSDCLDELQDAGMLADDLERFD